MLKKFSNKKYSATDVAVWFMRNIDKDAGEFLGHLKVQMLVYYAEAWSLVLLGRELVEESFHAWAYGPVAVTVYDHLNGYDWHALIRDALESDFSFDEETEQLLKAVQSVYGESNAKDLAEMAQKEEPWRKARGNIPLEARTSTPICKKAMAVYYTKLYDSANGTEQ